MITPNRLKQSPAYHRAPLQEQEAADLLGGHVTPGSGNRHVKGDVRGGGVRLECKATSNKSFSVTREMMDKISDAAETSGETPAILVEFLATGEHPGGKLVIVPEYILSQLMTLKV